MQAVVEISQGRSYEQAQERKENSAMLKFSK